VAGLDHGVISNIWLIGVNTPWRFQEIQAISCAVKQSKMSLAAGRASAWPHAEPHPGESLHVEEAARDINRVNAAGLPSAGYHVNRDADGERRTGALSVLA